MFLIFKLEKPLISLIKLFRFFVLIKTIAGHPIRMPDFHQNFVKSLVINLR